jgi:hypothetical protein
MKTTEDTESTEFFRQDEQDFLQDLQVNPAHLANNLVNPV